LLAALPYVAGFVTQQLNGWHSDKTGERRWHAALPVILCGAVLSLAVLAGSRPGLSIALFTLVGACFYGFQPCFWAVPTRFLSKSAAAASIGSAAYVEVFFIVSPQRSTRAPARGEQGILRNPHCSSACASSLRNSTKKRHRAGPVPSFGRRRPQPVPTLTRDRKRR